MSSFPVLAPTRIAISIRSLPPPILNRVLEELNTVDLCSFSQVSRSYYQIISNDNLWIPKLKLMGLWSEVKKAKTETAQHTPTDRSNGDLLFDDQNITGGLGSLSILTPDVMGKQNSTIQQSQEQDTPLNVIERVGKDKTPGTARLKYLRIFKCLYPYYLDIIQSGTHIEPAIFRVFRDPVDQAKMLSQIKVFAQSDVQYPEFVDNYDKLISVYEVFENAALGEFETAFDENDIDGKVKKFAAVLVTLNGGESCIQLFIQKNQLVYDLVGDASDFVDAAGVLNGAKFQDMLKKISESINKEAKVIDTIFPPDALVLPGLYQNIIEENLGDIVVQIVNLSKERDIGNYLDTVTLLYVYFVWFLNGLPTPSQGSPQEFKQSLKDTFMNIYDIYVETYFKDEYNNFSEYSKKAVLDWKKDAHEAEIATETLLLSNVSKAKDKRDILSSFKKVLMMPVSVMPFGNSSSSSTPVSVSVSNSSQGQPTSPTNGSVVSLQGTSNSDNEISRSSTPVNGLRNRNDPFGKRNVKHIPATLPTTEFDAKMAVMNNKLEGINTLFSLELVIDIIRKGRDSIHRLGKFAATSLGYEAREYCEKIFVELVKFVGGVHMHDGFEKALDTLQKYDSNSMKQREISLVDKDGKQINQNSAVEPLAIFAELVNIGDLIQQMIHVFFEEELIIRGYVDRNSFVSPSIKEKRKFEKMLDSYVANGLNKGIDVLMDQIEHILINDQNPNDFYPNRRPDSSQSASTSQSEMKTNVFKSASDFDMEPTLAARNVVNLLKLHTGLLAGSTDRSVIDVFQQEVGVRFFGVLCKHIKHQTISVEGSVKLLLDLNTYYNFVLSLKQKPVTPYFAALKEVGQMFLIDGKDAKELGKMLSDMSRFGGIFQPEEVFEFAQRREDWLRVRREIEKVMYGFNAADCTIM